MHARTLTTYPTRRKEAQLVDLSGTAGHHHQNKNFPRCHEALKTYTYGALHTAQPHLSEIQLATIEHSTTVAILSTSNHEHLHRQIPQQYAPPRPTPHPRHDRQYPRLHRLRSLQHQQRHRRQNEQEDAEEEHCGHEGRDEGRR